MGYAPRINRPFPSSVASSAMQSIAIADGDTYEFLNTTGLGLLHWVLFRARAAAGSDNMLPEIKIDGVEVQPTMSFANFNAYGFDGDAHPFQVLQYAADGNCTIVFHSDTGLIFHESLTLVGTNNTGAAKVMDCFYYLSKFKVEG